MLSAMYRAGIRIPEYGKFFACGIWNPGNLSCGILNPELWNPEYSSWNPESHWRLEFHSGIQVLGLYESKVSPDFQLGSVTILNTT